MTLRLNKPDVHTRIRESETFPRIRGAETSLVSNEKPPKEKRIREVIPRKELFRSHTLNTDPKSAKYMPFNEIVFPKLFNEEETASMSPAAALDQFWLAGFMDNAEREKPKDPIASVDDLSSVASGTSHISSHISSHITATTNDSLQANLSSKPPKSQISGLTIDDEYRLKQLEESLEKYEKRDRKKKKLKIPGINAYAAANKAIKQARKRKNEFVPTFCSDNLETIFDRERIEHLAARRIQKCWRHCCLVAKLRFVVVCMIKAVKIQKYIRGYITRRRVAEWFHVRNTLIVQYQCRVRRYFTKKHLQPVLDKEFAAATTIQRIVLGKLGRAKAIARRRYIAAERIQALWRGVTARAKTDQQWLHKVVVPIQKTARGFVARLRGKYLKAELNEAALKIQRLLRSWRACRHLGETLYKRENIYREITAAVLTAEEEYYEDHLMKLGARLQKRGTEDKLRIMHKALQKSYDDVHISENDYVEIRRQRDILSTRAIQQGWVQQLDKNIIELRQQTTDWKLKSIFTNLKTLVAIEDQVERKMIEIDHTAQLRQAEINDNRARNFLRFLTYHVREKRSRIADEKRKWSIRHYTKNGKPDPKRRPGRKWDDDAYAGPEKMMFSCGVDVDLNAMSEGTVKEKAMTGEKLGTEASLKTTFNQMTLQSYLQQVNQYEQLLNPLHEIMTKFMGGPPGEKQPQDMGWGPMGRELPKAMDGMGAVPSSWEQLRDKPKPPVVRKIKPRLGSTLDDSVTKDSVSTLDAPLPTRRGTATMNGRAFDDDDGSSLATSSLSSMSAPQKRRQSRFDSPRKASALVRKSVLLEQEELALVPVEPVDEATAARQAAERERKLKRKEKFNQRKRSPAVIPWELLDKLESEKKAFEDHKNYVEFYQKL